MSVLSDPRDVLSYDKSTGEFRWLVTLSVRAMAGSVAGCTNRLGYRVIRIGGCLYLAHRLAWLYVHGEWPPIEIDHINGNRGDNRLENLRLATRAQNCQNTRKAARKGARPMRGKWQARIRANGVQHHLGTFASKEEAEAAYLSASKALHGRFAGLA